MRSLNATLSKIAREQLHESPDRIAQDLIILKVWITQQPHLKARTHNQLLIAFLRRCCYSLEETKKRIDRFYSFYNVFHEVLLHRRITKSILELNRLGFHCFVELPKPDNQAAILFIKPSHYFAKGYNLREVTQFLAITMEIMAMENDNTTVAGLCIVADFTEVSIEYLRFFDTVKNRNIGNKWIAWMRDCCPIRTREIFVISPQNTLYQTLTWKLNGLSFNLDYTVTVVRNAEELFKYIPQKYFPMEYGGNNGSFHECVNYMEDLLKRYRHYFDDDINYGTCEELRSGDVVVYEAEFGACGSFRKLNAD